MARFSGSALGTSSSVPPNADRGILFQNGTVVQGRTLIAPSLLVALLSGCDAAPTSAPPPPTPVGEAFDPSAAGTVRGRVVWEGPVPVIEPFRAMRSPNGVAALGPRFSWPNPNAPVLAADGGVADVVVFLRGVDPARSRPWDHPSVVVELRDYRMLVRQGDYEGRNGIVRRGDRFEVVSRMPVYQGVLGRGAAFFSLPLPDVDRPWRHRLDRSGVVELSSSAGQFWMRAWLHVADHPYYVRTAADGGFVLPQVPAGAYELVCRLPDWHVSDRERDADTCQVSRIEFAPAVEIVQPIRVAPAQTTETRLRARTALFADGVRSQ
jgi:hypothetical protein